MEPNAQLLLALLLVEHEDGNLDEEELLLFVSSASASVNSSLTPDAALLLVSFAWSFVISRWRRSVAPFFRRPEKRWSCWDKITTTSSIAVEPLKKGFPVPRICRSRNKSMAASHTILWRSGVMGKTVLASIFNSTTKDVKALEETERQSKKQKDHGLHLKIKYANQTPCP